MNLFLMFYTSGHLRNIDLTNVCFHLYFLTNRVKVSTKSNFSHLHRTDRQTDRQTDTELSNDFPLHYFSPLPRRGRFAAFWCAR